MLGERQIQVQMIVHQLVMVYALGVRILAKETVLADVPDIVDSLVIQDVMQPVPEYIACVVAVQMDV